MKPSQRLARTAVVFIKKDWREFRKPIAVLNAGLIALALLLLANVRHPDIFRGMIGSALLGGPFLYAQSCFTSERQHGTLPFLLALPITRGELAVAKFASMFSMTLVTVNAPALLLGDPRFMFYANAAALFLASLFMSATMVSDKPWAPQIPFWFVIMLSVPFAPLKTGAWIAAHRIAVATAALTLTPLVAIAASWIYSRQGDKGI